MFALVVTYRDNGNLFLSGFLTLTLSCVLSGNKPLSPYSGYNGQMRSSVYQPTELAIITKGVTNVSSCIYQSCFAYANSHSTILFLHSLLCPSSYLRL